MRVTRTDVKYAKEWRALFLLFLAVFFSLDASLNRGSVAQYEWSHTNLSVTLESLQILCKWLSVLNTDGYR